VKRISSIVLAVSVFWPSVGASYELATHAKITNAAFSNSAIGGASSLQADLGISVWTWRTGHTYLDVHLHDGAPPKWAVDISIELEAGQLERLAKEVAQFEKVAINAA
jgi:hypothetical protein